MAIPEITCTTDPNTPTDFVMHFGTTSYDCQTMSQPVVVLSSSGMTLQDFNTLWPLLVGLLVTGYIFRTLRRSVEGRFT